jgi:mannose-6-phosphate isomerase-like protein (cupin superfamily)
MKGYSENIEEKTTGNSFFRQVVFTGANCQVVLMSLKPGEEIGMEVHPKVDQFFRFESGEGKVIIDGEEHLVKDGFAVVVPQGAMHNVINTSAKADLKLYTIYSPPNHPPGTVHKTKTEADKAEEEEHKQD